MLASAIPLPIPDRSIDRIFLWSVFTHLLEPDVRHYLREFKRVMRPGGRILASWFIVDEHILRHIEDHRSPLGDLAFRHKVADSCYINDQSEPLGAVAYTLALVETMITNAGLSLYHLQRGYWSTLWPGEGTGRTGPYDLALKRSLEGGRGGPPIALRAEQG